MVYLFFQFYHHQNVPFFLFQNHQLLLRSRISKMETVQLGDMIEGKSCSFQRGFYTILKNLKLQINQQNMKQQVISYEFQILQNHLICTPQPHPSHQSDTYRYTAWNLSATLNQIPNSDTKDLKWIGNADSSFIIAYFYCLFSMCSGNEDILLSLKHSLYKICQYCLNLSEQKCIVEFVGYLAQNRPLISQYLQKKQAIQELLVKVYETSISLVKLQAINSAEMDKFSKLMHYSSVIFPFLIIQTVPHCQNALEVQIDGKEDRIFILREKECYFILQNRFFKYQKQYNIIKNLQWRSPTLDECVIIDEENEDEQTLMKDSSKNTSKVSRKKSTSSKKESAIYVKAQSPQKSKVSKIPNFLFDQKRKKATIERESMKKQAKVQIPLSFNKSNQFLQKSKKQKVYKYEPPKNSVQKSRSKSKHSQQHSGEKQLPKTVLYNLIKHQPRVHTEYAKNKSMSFANISPSARYGMDESRPRKQSRKYEEKMNQMEEKNKIMSKHDSFVKRFSQEHKNKLSESTGHHETSVHEEGRKIHYPKAHKNTKSTIPGRLSQSPVPPTYKHFHPQ